MTYFWYQLLTSPCEKREQLGKLVLGLEGCRAIDCTTEARNNDELLRSSPTTPISATKITIALTLIGFNYLMKL